SCFVSSNVVCFINAPFLFSFASALRSGRKLFFPVNFLHFFRTKEKAPDRKKHFLSRASHLKSRHPWCHLAFAVIPHTYRNTIIFLATNVCLHVMEYSANAFPHALGGPFETPLSARLSPARTLCERACNV